MSVHRLPNGAIPLPAAMPESDRDRLRQEVEADQAQNENTVLWLRINRGEGAVLLSISSYLMEGNLELAVRALNAGMSMLQELAATIHAKETGEQVDHQGKELTRH